MAALSVDELLAIAAEAEAAEAEAEAAEAAACGEPPHSDLDIILLILVKLFAGKADSS